MAFLLFWAIHSASRYQWCSRQVPSLLCCQYLNCEFSMPLSMFPLAFCHLFPGYACFAYIHLASLLFPVHFAISCFVHPREYPSVSWWGFSDVPFAMAVGGVGHPCVFPFFTPCVLFVNVISLERRKRRGFRNIGRENRLGNQKWLRSNKNRNEK